jgi:hypothetical protein
MRSSQRANAGFSRKCRHASSRLAQCVRRLRVAAAGDSRSSSPAHWLARSAPAPPRDDRRIDHHDAAHPVRLLQRGHQRQVAAERMADEPHRRS